MKKIILSCVFFSLLFFASTAKVTAADLEVTGQFTPRTDGNPGAILIVTIVNTIKDHLYNINVQNKEGTKNMVSDCPVMKSPGYVKAYGTPLTVAWGCLLPGEYKLIVNDIESFATTKTFSFTVIKDGGSLIGSPTIRYCDPATKTKLETALGCIPVRDTAGFIGWVLKLAIGIGGGIAFLLMLFGVFQIITSAGDPERLKAGKELITSALIGLLMIIFSLFLLRLIGVEILKIPGFGG